MGITVKNLRPCVLILADAGLRLGPGETAEIAMASPQVQKALDRGLLARMDDCEEAGAQTASQSTGPSPEALEPAAQSGDAESAARHAGQGGKRPPLDALRRKAEETAGGAG